MTDASRCPHGRSWFVHCSECAAPAPAAEPPQDDLDTAFNEALEMTRECVRAQIEAAEPPQDAGPDGESPPFPRNEPRVVGRYTLTKAEPPPDVAGLIARLNERADKMATQGNAAVLREAAAELAAMAHKIAEGKAERDCLIIDYQNEHRRAEQAERERDEADKTIAALRRAEALRERDLAEAREDAERYRWLRENHNGNWYAKWFVKNPPGFDAAIDAARKGGK